MAYLAYWLAIRMYGASSSLVRATAHALGIYGNVATGEGPISSPPEKGLSIPPTSVTCSSVLSCIFLIVGVYIGMATKTPDGQKQLKHSAGKEISYVHRYRQRRMFCLAERELYL